jgi:hypothetical protein
MSALKKETVVYEKDIESLETIKRKIEEDAYNKTMKLHKENIPKEKAGEKLISIMSTGAEEFKQKTGREMTYSEMREMYG